MSVGWCPEKLKEKTGPLFASLPTPYSKLFSSSVIARGIFYFGNGALPLPTSTPIRLVRGIFVRNNGDHRSKVTQLASHPLQHSHHNLNQDEQDDDPLQNLRAALSGPVGELLVDAVERVKLSADA